MLVIFVTMGLLLEALHGFKIGWYLDVGNEARRLMLRLGHAHGTLLGLLNIAFAVSIPHLQTWRVERAMFASGTLKIASVLIPGGFIAGGFFIYDGDPGLGIFLLPFGAVALWLAVTSTAIAARNR